MTNGRRLPATARTVTIKVSDLQTINGELQSLRKLLQMTEERLASAEALVIEALNPVIPDDAPGMRRLLTMREVSAKVNFSRATIYRMMEEKTFPRNATVGLRGSRWFADEIDTWLSERKIGR